MIDWRRLCAGASDITQDPNGLTVDFANGRRQRLDVRETDDAIELRGVVVRRAIAEQLSDGPLAAWERNRASRLVGFRVDDRGRIVGEAWVPTAGLTRGEFLYYVRSAAVACDLFEFQLAGHDRE